MPTSRHFVALVVLPGRAEHHDRRAPSFASSRIRRATSKPSISGMFASSSTSANGRPRSLALEQRAHRRGAAVDDGRPHPPAQQQIVQHAAVHAVVVDDQHRQIGQVDCAAAPGARR